MAWYKVMMGECGHEERIQLYGPGREREARIKYLNDYGLCSECYRKQRKENHDKYWKEAKENNASINANNQIVISFETVEDGTRKIKTGVKDGKFIYRELAPDEDFTVKFPAVELKGSEKQVIYANDIKTKYLKKNVKRLVDSLTEKTGNSIDDIIKEAAKTIDPSIKTLQNLIDWSVNNNANYHKIFDEILTTTSAKTIIENYKHSVEVW